MRTIKSWGTQTLPEKMRRHKVSHEIGEWVFFCFFFFSSLSLSGSIPLLNEETNIFFIGIVFTVTL